MGFKDGQNDAAGIDVQKRKKPFTVVSIAPTMQSIREATLTLCSTTPSQAASDLGGGDEGTSEAINANQAPSTDPVDLRSQQPPLRSQPVDLAYTTPSFLHLDLSSVERPVPDNSASPSEVPKVMNHQTVSTPAGHTMEGVTQQILYLLAELSNKGWWGGKVRSQTSEEYKIDIHSELDRCREIIGALEHADEAMPPSKRRAASQKFESQRSLSAGRAAIATPREDPLPRISETRRSISRSVTLPPLNDGPTCITARNEVSFLPESARLVNKSFLAPEPDEDHETHLRWADLNWYTTVFPALRPTDRRDVKMLERWLFDNLKKKNVDIKKPVEAYNELMVLYSVTFLELLRQVSVGCVERAELLGFLWKGYLQIMENFLDYGKSERDRYETNVAKFKEAKKEYDRKLKDLEQKLRESTALNSILKEKMNVQQEEIRKKDEQLSAVKDQLKKIEDDLNSWLPQWKHYFSSSQIYSHLKPYDFQLSVAYKMLHPEEYRRWRSSSRSTQPLSSASHKHLVAGNNNNADSMSDVESNAASETDYDLDLSSLDETDCMREDAERLLAAISHVVDHEKMLLKHEVINVKEAFQIERKIRYECQDTIRRLENNCDELLTRLNQWESRDNHFLDKASQTDASLSFFSGKGAAASEFESWEDDGDNVQKTTAHTKLVPMVNIHSSVPPSFRKFFTADISEDFPKRVMPVEALLRIVHDIYCDKILVDAVDDLDDRNRVPMPEFVVNFFSTKYGSARRTEQTLIDLFSSLRHHYDFSLRVQMFCHFVGIPSKQLSLYALDFYLKVMASMLYSGKAHEYADGQVWIPADFAVEMFRRIFKVPELTDGLPMSLKRVQELGVEREVEGRKDSRWVNLDRLLELAMMMWTEETDRKQPHFQQLFKAANVDSDGRLSEAEFRMICMYAMKNSTDRNIARVWLSAIRCQNNDQIEFGVTQQRKAQAEDKQVNLLDTLGDGTVNSAALDSAIALSGPSPYKGDSISLQAFVATAAAYGFLVENAPKVNVLLNCWRVAEPIVTLVIAKLKDSRARPSAFKIATATMNKLKKVLSMGSDLEPEQAITCYRLLITEVPQELKQHLFKAYSAHAQTVQYPPPPLPTGTFSFDLKLDADQQEHELVLDDQHLDG